MQWTRLDSNQQVLVSCDGAGHPDAPLPLHSPYQPGQKHLEPDQNGVEMIRNEVTG